ncbi:MAG TPA: hypothetical protein VF715_15740 [Thermoleophilaceae bacterium]|jgi:hypothetical protein
MNTQLDIWRRVLDRGRLPDWLVAFADNPDRVLDDVLSGRELIAASTPDEAVDLLADWLWRLRDAGGFGPSLDSSLAQHICRNWERAADDIEHAITLARAFDLAGQVETLERAGGVLRQLVARRSLLQSAPAGVDLSGRYLNALARHQVDRRLMPLWRSVSSLPAGIPWHDARYAVVGVEFAPALAHEDGGFRAEVARAAVEAVRSITRKVVEKEIEPDLALREQEAIAHLSFRAYPSEDGWCRVVSDSLLTDAPNEPTLRSVFAFLPLPGAPALRSQSTLPDPRGWAEKANAVARRLAADEGSSRDDAEHLLGLQRTYAARTGDPHFVVMSLSNFAGAIRHRDVTRAESWAREAIWWQPSEASGWTALAVAITLQDAIAGVALAWTAVARFPDNGNVLAVLVRALEIAELRDTAALIAGYHSRRFGGQWAHVKGGSDATSARERLVETSPEALVGEARIRRREARLAGDDGLLDSARRLIEQAAERWPAHASLQNEAPLVGLKLERENAAAEHYLAAWRDRERKRGRRMRSDHDIEELLAPWRRLREGDQTARPAALLGQGRACLAAVDGTGLVDEARYALTQLSAWGDGHRRTYVSNTFEANWLGRIESIIDLPRVGQTDVGLLRAIESVNAPILDELEEDVAVPLDRSAGFDPEAALAPIPLSD